MANGNKDTETFVGQAHAVIEPGKSIPIWKIPPDDWTYWRAPLKNHS